MIWQDVVITIANIIFSLALIPQVIEGFKGRKGFVTLITSGPTFIGLYSISIAFYTLLLFLSSITAFIAGTLWLTLFIQRLIYRKA